MNKYSKEYIRKDIQRIDALYNAYKVFDESGDSELLNVLESRIEQILIELVDELEMEDHRTHLKFYGFVDDNGDTSIVSEILEVAKGVI